MAPRNTPEFAARVREAVAALGLTQAQITERGGPSDTTLRKIMGGELVGISAATLKKIDTSLGWMPGSAIRVLQGGEPTPASDTSTDELSDGAARLRSQVIHPNRATKLYAAAEESEEVAQLLIDIIENRIDDETRARALDLFDDITIRDFPAQFEKLSKQGKVQVARYASRVLLQETDPTKEIEDDISTKSTTEVSEGEADPHEKMDAGGPRNELNLIPGGQVAEVDDAPPSDALADAARIELDHLTKGKRQDLEQAISSMSAEELRAAAAQDPLLDAFVRANYPKLAEGWDL